MKKLNKKGFTLAELLIVVAIIAVLVAISIPIFTAQLNKAKYSADEANARSIYSEMVADYLANGGAHTTGTHPFGVSPAKVNADNKKQTVTVSMGDGSTNVFEFSGIVEVEFTLGGSAYPQVKVGACEKAGVSSAVVFGSGTAASD